ncbi:penicillin-insensitive transglycosylase [Klebsiella michiganensis]|nr:penicillin-insensitive transglycosylase [Klebsiella michiganensis]
MAEDGTPLWRFADAQGVWRYPVTLADVSPRYLQALIQYEDRWFWDHPGVNPFSIVRAAWQDLTSGRVISGGSTLTMQVARLLDPHPRTFGGKLRQLWRRAAAGVASVKKRDPHALPQPGAVRRYAARGSAQPAGPISVNRPRSSAMAKRRCWRYCRRRRAGCVRIAGRSERRRRAIRCCCGWKIRACGHRSRYEKLSRSPSGSFRGRCRSWRRFLPAARWRAAAQRRW